jgi:hypothetical protein
VWNVRTCRLDIKGDIQGGENEATDDRQWGEEVRMSDEGSVMELERRGCIFQLYLKDQTKVERIF